MKLLNTITTGDALPETSRAYLAGCMDGEGTYTIIARNDGIRCEPWTMLNMTTPQVPNLLKAACGGTLLYVESKPPRRNRYMWRATGSKAIEVCHVTLPYLLVKRRQAEILLELWDINHTPKFRQYAYWYELEHPNWRNEKLLTYPQVVRRLGYSHISVVRLALRQGSLLALQGKPAQAIPRVPEGLVDILEVVRRQKVPQVPEQLLRKRQALLTEVHTLNRRGIDVAS